MLRYVNYPNQDKTVIEVHIADIHFGAVDPESEFDILRDQFLNHISKLKFNILSIDGDLFDKKYLVSSPAATYAMRFVLDCVELCKRNHATMIIISGTESHDAGQLSLFYGLTYRDDIDFRIVEKLQFEYAQGLKILCVPEEHGRSDEYYIDKLKEDYDTAFIHGTVVGSVYGANKYALANGSKPPVFNMEAFSGCRGPIIAGHVHKAACYENYIYYVSNPVRYKFGEEEEKGYSIVIHGPKGHFYKFMPIKSYRYDTVNAKDIQYTDPQQLVQYLDNLKANGVDFVRLDFLDIDDKIAQDLLIRHYADDPRVTIKKYDSESRSREVTAASQNSKYAEMKFLIDDNADGYTKFVQFVNYEERKQIITIDQLKMLLAGADIGTIF